MYSKVAAETVNVDDEMSAPLQFLLWLDSVGSQFFRAAYFKSAVVTFEGK
jgi:hypothetical protein